MTARYVAALDQGTTSSRCLLFDRAGSVVAVAQQEHRQITPRPGWVEHDADEILQRCRACVDEALAAAGARPGDVAAVGITNQRETVVLWERESGRPLANAIVWQDTRSAERVAGLGDVDRFREQTGLPLATYFSGPKLSWLLDSLPGARARAEAGELAAGTIDSWLAWHLAGVHVTDATNASRTLLMDLRTLDWDDGLLDAIGVPRPLLARIVPSSGVLGEVGGVPLAALLGDQHAALFGQCCFAPGEAKCTYGTGNFLVLNTGERAVPSRHGLITGVAYQLRGEEPVYMLEGSIAVTGALVQWLRDNLGLIRARPRSKRSQRGARQRRLRDRAGLLGPVRAALAIRRARRDLRPDALPHEGAHRAGRARGHRLRHARAGRGDGRRRRRLAAGAAGRRRHDRERPAMQIQADTLGLPVVRPAVIETTALGAAYAAGLAVGFWQSQDELRGIARGETRWTPRASEDERARGYAAWNAAVERSLGWV